MNIYNSIYSQDNRIYVDWDILYKCNLKCSYCYLGKTLNKKVDNIKYDNFLDILFLIKYDFTLGLLGGEPSQSKYYFKILEKLSNYFKNNILSEAYVSTNLTKSVEWYKNHKKYKNIHHWVSIHPEYYYNKIDELYLKLKTLEKNTHSQLIISPMLMSKKYNAFYKEVYQIFKNIQKNSKIEIIYSPQYVFDNEEHYNTVDFPPSNSLYNQSKKEFGINNKEFTINEVIYNGLYMTNNCKCYSNYFTIDPEFNYVSDCNHVNGSINNPVKLLKDFVPKIINCSYDKCDDFPKMLSKKC